MHTVDVVAVCAAGIALVISAAILARQRYMLRVAGAIPLAVRTKGNRWLYGVARYADGQLRWYRSLGLATRPTRRFDRSQVRIRSHRRPHPAEIGSLPATAVVVDCLVAGTPVSIALGEDAFTGFLSWIEASSPAA
ncbi:MAG: DUF2550 family protein [Jatrophihabitans sp.]|nr:MAG: DUF2550 family protein [Jatrophihabitans sp.]